MSVQKNCAFALSDEKSEQGPAQPDEGGAGGERRVPDCVDCGVILQVFCNREGGFFLCSAAQGEGAQAAPGERGMIGGDRVAEAIGGGRSPGP